MPCRELLQIMVDREQLSLWRRSPGSATRSPSEALPGSLSSPSPIATLGPSSDGCARVGGPA